MPSAMIAALSFLTAALIVAGAGVAATARRSNAAPFSINAPPTSIADGIDSCGSMMKAASEHAKK